LIIRNQSHKFGVFRGHIFPILSGNVLGQWVKILDLPGYLSWQLAMTGFFFRQSADTIIQQVDLIYKGFPKLERVEYLPWGERTIVYNNNQRIYLNNLGNIAEQISTYMLLNKIIMQTNGLKTNTKKELLNMQLDHQNVNKKLQELNVIVKIWKKLNIWKIKLENNIRE
jgi:hypothetical protein